jgi:NTE family protein
MSEQHHLELLLGNRIFASLSSADAQELYSAGSLETVSANQVLFYEGDVADGFYLVLQGYFGVTLVGDGGAEVPLAGVGPGETLGEMGIVTVAPRSATVTAVMASVAWHLPADVFEGLVARGDPMGTAILRSMGRDLCRRFRAAVSEGANLVAQLALGDDRQVFVDNLGWEV